MVIKNFEQFTTDELRREVERREKLETEERNKHLHVLTVRCVNEVKEALKKFGENTFGDFSYDDFSYDEVMNIHKLVDEFDLYDSETISKILSQCLDTTEVKSDFMELFVSTVIRGLDHREDFDHILNSDDRFEY